MNQTNLDMQYHARFHPDFLATRSQPGELQTSKLMWWSLAIIELLLIIRLIAEYLAVSPSSSFTLGLYSITNYILYPFTATLTNASPVGSYGWVTIVAMTGYFLLAIALVSFFSAIRSPHSRIEHARELSRRKYSR